MLPAALGEESAGICGGGSTAPGLVSKDNGSVDAGVEVRRSLYDMKESRLVGTCVGDGGCEIEIPAIGKVGAYSLVVVVGDPSTDELVEKYADVGVTIDGGDPTLHCRLSNRLFLSGEGLRDRSRTGLAQPLPIARLALTAGASTATPSAFPSDIFARISAAESSTEGTDDSSVSVVLERGIRCGFVGCSPAVAGGETGSMSRSNIAELEECTDVGELGIEVGDLDPPSPMECLFVRSLPPGERLGDMRTELDCICLKSAGGGDAELRVGDVDDNGGGVAILKTELAC